MKRLILVGMLSLVAGLLSGCMQHNAQIYVPLIPNEKTVTVPAGSSGLKGEIKKALAAKGWAMLTDKNETTTNGTIDKNIATRQAPDFGTRYRLYIAYHVYDWCMNGVPAVNYELSMIDNKTSAEVFTLDGSGCENGAVEKFNLLLDGRTE